jgi:serine/threonine protein kinase
MDERTIFFEALDKGSTEQRTDYLNEVCGDDAALRQRVESLLAAHNDAGSFLEKTPNELDSDAVNAANVDGSPMPTVGRDLDHDNDPKSDDAWQSLLTPTDVPERLGMIGPYEIIELVGRGGMGVVLRAHEPKLSRTVAVKLLAPELAVSATAVQRFLREARAAAAVSHDHVVAIHSIDDEARPPVIIMEYIEGQSLQQKIDKVGALDVKSILRIGMQTAAGLSAAHRQGLVHRDIKPANILLENGVERVKLTDFGLARAVDDISMTRTGQITGTPQYMSPEQAQGQRVDHRTDLFSLGCVLYAMCTGRAAFRADSAVAVMHRVVHDVPRPIREVNEDIPDWLCDIVSKLLAKDPDDRFESALEVEDLLSRHLAHLQQPASVPQPERLTWPADSATVTTEASQETEDASASAAPTPNIPRWLLWKFPGWTPLLLIPVVVVPQFLSRFGPSEYADFAKGPANLLVLAIAFPLSIFFIISNLRRARREQKAKPGKNDAHTGFWMLLFAIVPIAAAGITKGQLGLSGPTAVIISAVIAMLGVTFLLRARKNM